MTTKETTPTAPAPEQPQIRADLQEQLDQEALSRARADIERLQADLADAKIASQGAQTAYEAAQRAWDRAEEAGIAHSATDASRLSWLTSEAQSARQRISLIQQQIAEAEAIIRSDAEVAARLRRQQLVGEVWPPIAAKVAAAARSLLAALEQQEVALARLESEPGAVGMCSPAPLWLSDYVPWRVGESVSPQLSRWLLEYERVGNEK